jgi:hypothetical protein
MRLRKMRPRGVLIDENDVIMIAWTLAMQECKLSISLQLSTTKDEGCRSDTNNDYTLSKRYIKNN